MSHFYSVLLTLKSRCLFLEILYGNKSILLENMKMKVRIICGISMLFDIYSTILTEIWFSNFCSTFQSPWNKKKQQMSTFLSHEKMYLQRKLD